MTARTAPYAAVESVTSFSNALAGVTQTAPVCAASNTEFARETGEPTKSNSFRQQWTSGGALQTRRFALPLLKG